MPLWKAAGNVDPEKNQRHSGELAVFCAMLQQAATLLRLFATWSIVT
jgi:hypothetical protein